jgi:hypothetical protein
MQWRRIQMFVSAWVGSFVLNHLINLCFPAMSPRIYLKELYKNELHGLWLLGGLRNAVTNAAANTYSAFPSGHCGLSILATIISFKIGYKTYSYIVFLTTVLIVCATQVLRYHYFVDFLFSFPIVWFGVWLGGFHDHELVKRTFHESEGEGGGGGGNTMEDHDEEGKPVQEGNQHYEHHVPLLQRENINTNQTNQLDEHSTTLHDSITTPPSSTLSQISSSLGSNSLAGSTNRSSKKDLSSIVLDNSTLQSYGETELVGSNTSGVPLSSFGSMVRSVSHGNQLTNIEEGRGQER